MQRYQHWSRHNLFSGKFFYFFKSMKAQKEKENKKLSEKSASLLKS